MVKLCVNCCQLFTSQVNVCKERAKRNLATHHTGTQLFSPLRQLPRCLIVAIVKSATFLSTTELHWNVSSHWLLLKLTETSTSLCIGPVAQQMSIRARRKPPLHRKCFIRTVDTSVCHRVPADIIRCLQYPESFNAQPHWNTGGFDDVCTEPSVRCLHPDERVSTSRRSISQFERHCSSCFHTDLHL